MSPFRLTRQVHQNSDHILVDLSLSTPRARRTSLAAALGLAAVAATASSAAPALAAAAPGQPIANDYGQSDAQVAVEVATAVNADPAVVAARTAASHAHTVLAIRTNGYTAARNAYVYARAHHYSAARMARAAATLAAATKQLVAARAASSAAALKVTKIVASTTARVRATHFRPVDGVWAGNEQIYFIPGATPPTEPLTVQVTVYAGHVSDVAVIKQADPSTTSYREYNSISLSTLEREAMTLDGSAAVAWVSGATLTSDAFQNSLQSALIKAGFHA